MSLSTATLPETRIPWAKPFFSGQEKHAVIDALESGWISGGPYVEQFERQVKELTGARFALAVSNGTTALHLALMALDIGPDDEVIVPNFTFVAPASMVVMQRARVVTADIDPDTWMLDLDSVAQAITPRTKAIIPVHLYGNTPDMQALMALANAHGIAVIEDGAEAFGSRHQQQYTGTMGTIGTYSFHATKTITTGEGGMVLTQDPALYEKMRILREHGMQERKRYWHVMAGHNFRLTNMQAAMGCAQLDQFPSICQERMRVYHSYLRHLDGVTAFVPQYFAAEVQPVVWAFAGKLVIPGITVEELAAKRDAIVARLEEKNIETRPGFYPLSALPPFQASVQTQKVSVEIGASVLSLPTFPDLSDAMIAYIVAELKDALSKEIL
jgi:perosamine synthetase